MCVSISKIDLFTTQSLKIESEFSNFIFSHPQYPDITGRRFYGLDDPVKADILKKYLDAPTVLMNPSSILYPQILMAASNDHFLEMMASARLTLETFDYLVKILVYDIGLTERQAQFLRNHPNFIYKKFDFTNLDPIAESNKSTMVWKVLTWTYCLMEYGACIWLDASVHIAKPFFETIDNDFYKEKRSFAWGIRTAGHTAIWGTHPEMISYLPTNISFLEQRMHQSGGEIFYNTEDFKHGVMKWMIACALTPSCLYPESSLNADPSLFNQGCNLG